MAQTVADITIENRRRAYARWIGGASGPPLIVTGAQVWRLIDFADVRDGDVDDGSTLIWSQAAQEWVPGPAALVAGAGAITSVAGKIGVVTLNKGDVGLSLVDNTADASKPVSSAQQTALDGKAGLSHTHTSASISDFAEAAQDALAAALQGSGTTITYNDAGNTITISGVGDPEAVRDAIGVALIGVGNITVTVDDAADTLTISTTATVNSTDAALRDRSTHTGTQVAATISDFAEAAQDVIGAALVAGTGVTVAYNDAANTITITPAVASVAGRTGAVTLGKADVGLPLVDNTADTAKPVSTIQQSALDGKAALTHTHTSSQITDFVEAAQDALAAALAGTTGVTVTYNDAANTITITGIGDMEAIRDAMGVAIVGAGLVSVVVNDAADTITVSTTATANDTDANLKSRANHTGTQSADTLTDGTTNKAFTATERTKLTGVATGATANATDSALRDRSTHTGTQLSTTVSDFTEAAQDAVAAALVAGAGVTITYNDAGNAITITSAVTSVAGRTGAVTLGKGDVGLGSVDNTSDVNKPISTAVQAALDTKTNYKGDWTADLVVGISEIVTDDGRGFVRKATGAPLRPSAPNEPYSAKVFASAAAQSTNYGRRLSAVEKVGSKILLGYGDYGANTGPIDVGEVDVSTPLNTPTVTFSGFQSEQIGNYRELADGRVLATTIDARGPLGGHFIERSAGGVWTQHLNAISDRALHVFDVVQASDGTLFACGSAVDDPANVVILPIYGATGPGGGAIWKSTNGGTTWTLDYSVYGTLAQNNEEQSRFYSMAVVGNAVYAHSTFKAGAGELPEKKIKWTPGTGWVEVNHPFPLDAGFGKPWRSGWVYGPHSVGTGAQAGLHYFDGTTLTELAPSALGFDVDASGVVWYFNANGEICSIPATGPMVATVVATADTPPAGMNYMAVLSSTKFAFGGQDSRLYVYEVGQVDQASMWESLGGRHLLNPITKKVSPEFLPPLDITGQFEGAATEIANGQLGCSWPEGGSLGANLTDARLFIQEGFLWVMFSLGVMENYVIFSTPDANGNYTPLIHLPAWMTEVPTRYEAMATFYSANNYGGRLPLPDREAQTTGDFTREGTTSASVTLPLTTSYLKDQFDTNDWYSSVSFRWNLSMQMGGYGPGYSLDPSLPGGIYLKPDLWSMPQDVVNLIRAQNGSPPAGVFDETVYINGCVVKFAIGDIPDGVL